MKIAIPLSLIVVFSMIACTKPKLPVQATLPTENAPVLQLNLDGFTDVNTVFIKNDPQVDYIISGYQLEGSKFFEYWIEDNKLSATISFPIFDINYGYRIWMEMANQKLYGPRDLRMELITAFPNFRMRSRYCSWLLIRYCAIKPVWDSSFGDIPGM